MRNQVQHQHRPDTYTNADSITYPYTNADSVHWEMFTHTKAVSDFGRAAHPTASSNSAANTYWLAAPNSAAAALAGE